MNYAWRWIKANRWVLVALTIYSVGQCGIVYMTMKANAEYAAVRGDGKP